MKEITELDAFLAENPDLRHLDVLLVDLCGNIFGKRVPASSIGSVFDTGTPVCAAMQLVDVQGNTADPMGHGFSDGDPDAFAIPIPATLKRTPWLEEGRAQVLCEFRQASDGNPLWYEPRRILRNVLARFDNLGLTPCVAVELEFYLLDACITEDGEPVTARSPFTNQRDKAGQVLSLDKLDEFDHVLSNIENCCQIQGIPTTSMISEYGAGQFEINLQHQTDVLAAADNAALLRRAIKGASRSSGYAATFMSKPFAEESGSGMHIHVSLLDSEGRNIFDPDIKDADQKVSAAIAGLQATMAEAMAIFAPNINVYRRFKPDEFVPVTTDWGENNRSVAFRIPPGDNKNRRIEHRVSGADANPYLVLAAVLSGIHHGLENNLSSDDKKSGNAGSEVDEDLPLTLWQAIDSFRNAEILRDYLSEDYLQIYSDVKQAEFEAFMEKIHHREYEWYL